MGCRDASARAEPRRCSAWRRSLRSTGAPRQSRTRVRHREAAGQSQMASRSPRPRSRRSRSTCSDPQLYDASDECHARAPHPRTRVQRPARQPTGWRGIQTAPLWRRVGPPHGRTTPGFVAPARGDLVQSRSCEVQGVQQLLLSGCATQWSFMIFQISSAILFSPVSFAWMPSLAIQSAWPSNTGIRSST